MNAYVLTVLSAALAYLAGSIPFGYLMGLTRGVDIRTVGSGNIGATNVFRTLGKKLGVFTFALDVAKGVAAVAVVPQAVWACAGAGAPPLGALVACAAAVMLGHAFPVFLGFKGGKGVATGLGLAIGLAPHSALLGLAVWIVVFGATRYVSVGSVLAALVVGAAPWWLDRPADGGAGWNAVCAAISILAALVVLKHRSNLARLARGTENRFCFTERQRAERERRRAEREAAEGKGA